MTAFIAQPRRSSQRSLACAVCLAGLLALPAGAAFAQSPGDMLDEGLNRLNRAFEELTQSGEGGGTAAAPAAPASDRAIALTVDATTRIWCPNEQTMALIGAFAPVAAEMSNRGVLTVEGEGDVRLDLQPGAGCALIVE